MTRITAMATATATTRRTSLRCWERYCIGSPPAGSVAYLSRRRPAAILPSSNALGHRGRQPTLTTGTARITVGGRLGKAAVRRPVGRSKGESMLRSLLGLVGRLLAGVG